MKPSHHTRTFSGHPNIISAQSFSVCTAFLLCVALTTSFFIAFASPATPPANAADGQRFNPGNIISDAVFFNGYTMSSYDIQSFLNSKVPRCTSSGYPCLKDYRTDTHTKGATAFCSPYEGRSNESAAEIIQHVSIACSINPQVLLVTLQKERSLITKTSPTAGDYQISMGYACPDTAPCDEEYYGFFNQVYNAASQFQRYTKTPNNWGYQVGRVNTIQYAPNPACGSSNVYIENQATANLYIYTPYQPNAAALTNLYGSGDGCSAYGNRNFWVYFTDWFGAPTGLQSGSFEGGNVAGWNASNGPINQAVYNDPAKARDGNFFLAISTPVSGRALTQDVASYINTGEQAVARFSLRSGTGAPFKGTVALWGIGGGTPTEVATTQFVATDSWNDLALRLIPQTSHSVLRLDIYMETTQIDLFIDAVSLEIGPGPVPENMLHTPSFEGSFAGWEASNGHIDHQIYNDPSRAQSGSWFAAISTPAAGRSLAQDIHLPSNPGDKYTFIMYVRSSSPTESVNGTLALWGLGGTRSIAESQHFEAGSDWSAVEVSLPLANTNSRHLKAEIYLDTPSTSLWIDNGLVAVDQLTSPSFENDSFIGWERSGPDVNHAVYPTSPTNSAHGGMYFAATNTSTSGESLRQDVKILPFPGDTYTARIWVRTPQSGEVFSGELALWALGGSAEVATTTFIATSDWELVTVRLPVSAIDHTSFRLQIYENTVSQTVFLDDAQLF